MTHEPRVVAWGESWNSYLEDPDLRADRWGQEKGEENNLGSFGHDKLAMVESTDSWFIVGEKYCWMVDRFGW
jgi:hypothetical protein